MGGRAGPAAAAELICRLIAAGAPCDLQWRQSKHHTFFLIAQAPCATTYWLQIFLS